MEDEILDLYFNKKMKQIEISNTLNISKYKVSRILIKHPLYYSEKEERKEINKQKHNKDIQKRVEQKRRTQQFNNNVDDLVLKNLHNQASVELSKRSHLTNENYRKWNYSAYQYNPSKKRYEFNENLGRSYDVPKYIKER